MQRDLDLIRKIILAVEDLSTGSVNDSLEVENYNREQIGYHSYLIIDSGLAYGIDCTFLEDTSPIWRIQRLTSAGHDFADSARNDTNWNNAKEIIKDGGGATLGIVKDILASIIKKTIGLE